MKKTWCALALAACVGLLTITPRAQASILVPGDTVTPPSQDGVLGPPNFDSFGFLPFSAGGVSGMYREFVSIGRTGSPFGGLSFEYQFMLDATSAALGLVAVNGYAGWLTNVTFAPGGTVAPISASRSVDGDTIGFVLPPLDGGLTSMWLIVDTNAPGEAGNTIFLNGGGPGLPALGPAVPEPGSLTLALIGVPLACAFGYRRLRRSQWAPA
jgi:hypothetical protein